MIVRLNIVFLIVFVVSSCNQKAERVEEQILDKSVGKKIVHVPSNKGNMICDTLDIQPFDNISESQISYVFKHLCKIHPHVNLLKAIPLPKRAYYAPRHRYRADTLIAYLRDRTKTGHVTVGLTNKDISTENGIYKDWGVMGLGFQPGKSCVVSTFRLSKNNLNDQYFKVVIHELGHTQGLPHCPDLKCYMRDAKGKNNTESETGFCEKCKVILISRKWKLD